MRVLLNLKSGLLVVLLLTAVAAAAPAWAQEPDIDFEVFYEELEPYGRWFEHPRWGMVFSPNVPPDWRPYSRGYWVYTEDGWYWEAEEEWGWAPFHYGRWVLDEVDGWLWVPGTEWAGAWVIWRWGDEYVGWAPLPPEADWGPEGTLVFDVRYYEGPRWATAWCFVRPHYMTTPGMSRFLLPRARNYVVLRQTVHVTHYRRVGRRVVNVGIDVRRLERTMGRPVPVVRLQAVGTPREHGWRRSPDRTALPVFRPNIVAKPGEPRFKPYQKGPSGDPAAISKSPPPFGPRALPSAPDGQPPAPKAFRRPDGPPPQWSQPPPVSSPPQVKAAPPPPAGQDKTVQPGPAAVIKVPPPAKGPPSAAKGPPPKDSAVSTKQPHKAAPKGDEKKKESTPSGG
jgi:hypothetical protein